MPVPLLDLTRQYETIQPELEAAALGVLRSGRYVLGEEGKALERELAASIGAKHVIGMSSGTDALLAALMGLGVGPGDRVAVPVYSFFATAGVVARLGAEPVFVDVEPTWCNLDREALAEVLDSGPIKAAVFVHLYGSAQGVAEITSLLAARGIPLVEDAAQAIGTRVDGRAAGTFGICGCFSTFPTKNLGGTGDGGFLATNDDDFATKMRQMRHHGQTTAYEHAFIGGNFRLDELQAACLRVKLRQLDSWTEARRGNAALYRKLVAAQGGDARGIELPTDVPDRHAYHQFVIHVPTDQRDALRERLREAEIGCSVYYPLPFHRQPCFRDLPSARRAFPVAEHKAASNLALPIFPELTTDEIEAVAAGLCAS
ncbi:MAG: DegT/DnrJ/EryC1/StrS family aminotransferase [Planctomycetota bacterium]